jgi:hypothetical protein
MRLSRMLGLATVVLVGSAQAASIGLYSDANCGSCNLTIPLGSETGTFYIIAVDTDDLLGPECAGLTGAQFRVQGLPAGWSASSTPSPLANYSLGNPLGAGADIAFPTRLLGGCILLYTVVVGPLSPGASALLQVTAHSSPAPPTFNCPLVVVGAHCPITPFVCVTGGILYLNMPGDCVVGAAPRTWSQVKRLF